MTWQYARHREEICVAPDGRVLGRVTDGSGTAIAQVNGRNTEFGTREQAKAFVEKSLSGGIHAR